MQPSPARPSAAPVVGLVLLAPAFVALVLSLLWPTLWTLWTSLQRSNLTESRFVGGENYARILTSATFWQSTGFAIVLAVGLVAAVSVVPPLLAYFADAGGDRLRIAARLGTSLPLAFLAPAAGAGAWLLWTSAPAGDHPLSDALRAPATVAGIVAASAFGAACGGGLLVYLAALRGGRGHGSGGTVVAMVAGWAVLAMAAVAVALQSFAPSFILTRGGPRGTTLTPVLLEYQLAFQRLDLGSGAVVATVLIVLLAILGVAATAVAIGTGLRVEVDARATRPATPAPQAQPQPQTGLPLVTVVAVALLVIAAVVILYGGWPRLAALFAARPAPAPYGRVLLNTIAPPLLGAIVQVLVAFLAALGIGGLRPLGARSEWLLLPFAPWLFVGVTPLSLADYAFLRSSHLVSTFPALVPPFLVSVPALFVLTLCCRGQAAAAARLVAPGASPADAFLRAVVVPVLPMVGLLLGAVALVGMQDLVWPLLVATNVDGYTLPLLMTQLSSQFAVGGSGVAFVVTLMAIPGLVALAALAAAQVLYLDRLRLRTGV